MLALLLAPFATADCASPAAFFSAAAVSPQRATVYYFSPYEGAPAFTVTDADGQPVPFSAEELGGALSAWQLDITAAEAGSLTLTATDPDAWWSASPATVTVGPGWLEPTPRRLTETKENVYSWSCDHQRTLDLHLEGPQPVAWTVEWADSKESWAAGKRTTAWLPGSVNDFYQFTGSGDEVATSTVLPLGYVSCLGDTFTAQGTIIARISAVDADGIHRPVTAEPVRLKLP